MKKEITLLIKITSFLIATFFLGVTVWGTCELVADFQRGDKLWSDWAYAFSMAGASIFGALYISALFYFLSGVKRANVRKLLDGSLIVCIVSLLWNSMVFVTSEMHAETSSYFNGFILFPIIIAIGLVLSWYLVIRISNLLLERGDWSIT